MNADIAIQHLPFLSETDVLSSPAGPGAD